MKRYAKYVLILALIALICALALGCGTTVETESDLPETELETQKAPHVHATTQDPVNVAPSTCSEQGYVDYRCDECRARYREELPLGKHEYLDQYDATLGYEVVKCNGCGDWRMEIDGKQERQFAAECHGDVTLSFEVIGDTAELVFTVDGVASTVQSFAPGKHTVTIAEKLAPGGHAFGFSVQNGGCALDLTDISVNGTLHRPNGVILEMSKAAANRPYSDFFVYVQTSDPSGDYYIRYRFKHSYSTAPTGEVNSENNINMFRIMAANLVKIKAVSETAVDYTDILSLLTVGEIAVAIKDPDTVDFIGGFHGDENITDLWMYADNVEYVPGVEKKVVVCSFLEFSQVTELNRCNVPEDKVVQHDQYYRITTNGLKCKREMTWLRGGYNHVSAFLQMFTLLRKSAGTGEPICEIVETFDENGKSLGREVIDYPIEKDTGVLANVANRSVHYSSATSGFTADVGFVILNDSTKVNKAYISARKDGTGDSKWYASFTSPTGSQTSIEGEVWSLDTFYHIDYVDPEN